VGREDTGRSVSPATLVRELDRRVASVNASVDAVVARPHPTAGSLHRLHRDLRRLRTALEVWESLLAHRDRERLLPFDQRLKRLARLVGRIRDRDVTIDLLAHADGPSWSAEETSRLGRYRTRLRDDARTGRELLRAFLRAEKDANLFSQMKAEWHRATVRYRGSEVRRILSRVQGEGEDRVRDAHRAARHKPSTSRLHRLRIRVRGLGHVTELVGVLDPTDARPLSAPVRRLQRDLGRLHDLDVALDGLAPEVRDTAWAASLRAERRRLKEDLLVYLEQKPARFWAKSRSPAKEAST
jgi:CHAD domain-containing protein